MSDHKGQLEIGLLAYLAHREVSPEAVCRQAGVDQKMLIHGQPLTLKKQNDLWMQASKLTHDPLLGLHLGESLQLAALGVVGEIIKYSSTVGQALTVAASMTPSLTGLVGISLERNRRTLAIQVTPCHPHGETPSFARRQILDLVMAFVLHELDGLLLTRIVPKAVWYGDPLPHKAEYTRVFRCEPVKKGLAYAILLDASAWEIPILTADFRLQKALLEKVKTLREESSFRQRIFRHLLSNAYNGIPGQADVAANLNMSTRSLQRRLREENITFAALAEEVRKALALHYLDAGEYPLKEISDMLGYNESSAFSRAFKRWTGQAPAAYRKQTSN